MEAGEVMLNKVIQYGDKLLPDTAAAGRDIIRQELTTARSLWHKLGETFAERKRVRDAEVEAERTCIEEAERLDTWLSKVQKQIASQSETQLDDLDAKRNHMKTMKVCDTFCMTYIHR